MIHKLAKEKYVILMINVLNLQKNLSEMLQPQLILKLFQVFNLKKQ